MQSKEGNRRAGAGWVSPAIREYVSDLLSEYGSFNELAFWSHGRSKLHFILFEYPESGVPDESPVAVLLDTLRDKAATHGATRVGIVYPATVLPRSAEESTLDCVAVYVEDERKGATIYLHPYSVDDGRVRYQRCQVESAHRMVFPASTGARR